VNKRIVINVEPGKTAPVRRKSRRWAKILAVLAIVVVAAIALAAVGGFLWWRHYQSTPAYSLTLLVDAALRSDAPELAKRIDDEELAKNVVANVSQKASERYGVAMNAATQQQIDKAMASLAPRLKQTVHDEVATEIKSIATTSEQKPFLVLLMLVPTVIKITTEGDVAKASSVITNHPFELTMRRDADRWKVIGFNDDTMVQRLVDSVTKELPPLGAVDSNSPLFKNPGKSRKKRR